MMESAVKLVEPFSGDDSHAACSKPREKLDLDVLLKLFASLDSVLQLLSRRGQRGFHSAVKIDVESTTGRDLSDYRLGCVLGLAGPNVIDFRWAKTGRDVKLEFFQRDANGKECFPSLEEMEQRRQNFKVALIAAEKSNRVPRVILPERFDSTPRVLSSNTIPSLPPQYDRKATSPSSAGAIRRRESLLERVRARERQAAERHVLEKKYNELRCKIGVCDDAEIVYKLLQSLFARGEGKSSAASEEEVLNGLCSVSFGMQCVKTLERPAAQAALKLLTEKSSQWFSVHTGVHNPNAKYLRRLPQGHGANALAEVHAERLSLETKIRELCESCETGMKAGAVSEVSLSNAPDPCEQFEFKSQSTKTPAKRCSESLEFQYDAKRRKVHTLSCVTQAKEARDQTMNPASRKRLRKKTTIVIV